MPDGVTVGELDRRQRDHEARTDRIHAEQDTRITNLAGAMVPVATFQAAEQAHRETVARLEREHAQDVAELRTELRELRERPALSMGRIAVIVTAVVAMLALMVQAYGTLKGAR